MSDISNNKNFFELSFDPYQFSLISNSKENNDPSNIIVEQQSQINSMLKIIESNKNTISNLNIENQSLKDKISEFSSKNIKNSLNYSFTEMDSLNQSDISANSNKENIKKNNNGSLYENIKSNVIKSLKKRTSIPRKQGYLCVDNTNTDSFFSKTVHKPKKESTLQFSERKNFDNNKSSFYWLKNSNEISENKSLLRNLAYSFSRESIQNIRENDKKEEMNKTIFEFVKFNDKGLEKVLDDINTSMKELIKKNNEMENIILEQNKIIKEYETLNKNSNIIRLQSDEINHGLTNLINKLIFINSEAKNLIDFCKNNEKDINSVSYSQQMEVILDEIKYFWNKIRDNLNNQKKIKKNTILNERKDLKENIDYSNIDDIEAQFENLKKRHRNSKNKLINAYEKKLKS